MSTNIVRYLAIASLHPGEHQEYATNKGQRYLLGSYLKPLLAREVRDVKKKTGILNYGRTVANGEVTRSR